MLRKVSSVMRTRTVSEFTQGQRSRRRYSTGENLSQDFPLTSEEKKGNNSKNYGGSPGYMRSWELHSYGQPSDLLLTHSAKIPVIRKPDDVIVQVKASSVNPLDVKMTSGYGAVTVNLLRHLDSPRVCEQPSSLLSAIFPMSRGGPPIEFPITLGRDFAGYIVELGNGVDKLKIGDEVMGVLGVQRTGCHAEYVVASSEMVMKKPKDLSFLEAASLPYVGLTAWSALHITGGYRDLNSKKVLVLGGSGGVGTFVIQYLRACGAYVVSTCSPDALSLLSELGCHFAVDYKDPNYLSYLQQQAPFDCILDLSGSSNQEPLLKFLFARTGQYITLSPPFISNVDKLGLLGGMVTNAIDVGIANVQSLQTNQVGTKWAFFIPCRHALETLVSLAESGKVKPVIQEVFKFEDIPRAYDKLGGGHSRGKIVVELA